MTKLFIFLAMFIACMAAVNSQAPRTSTTTTRPTTRTSTTTRRTTRRPIVRFQNPNLNFCNRKKDLFTADGKYVKSICMSMPAANYEEARKRCAANNMNLFIIDDEQVETLFYDGIMDIFKDIRDSFLWVNGKRQNFSNKWEVYKADGTLDGPLYSGLDFYSQNAMGYCLSYSAVYTNEYRPLADNCVEAKRFACEHHKRTEDPPRLDTSDCKHRKDLYYNGKYIKSMCVIHIVHNYDNARRKCASLGMNLFAYNSPIIYNAFNEASEEIFKTYAGSYYWINGRRDCHSNQWNLLNADGTISGPLYDGVEWMNRGAICGRTSGECLKLSGQYGPYQVMGNDCNTAMHIICEYKYT